MMSSKYYDPMQVVEMSASTLAASDNSGTTAPAATGTIEKGDGSKKDSKPSSRRTSPVPEGGSAPALIPEGTVSTHQWYAKNITKLTRKNKLTSPVFRVKHRLIGQNLTALRKHSVSGGSGVASGTSSSSGVAGGFFSVVSSLTSSEAKKKEKENEAAPTSTSTTGGDDSSSSTHQPKESHHESVWYFRIIMLKGLEPAEEEAGDPYGVFVEFLPNHIPAIAMEGASEKEKKEAEELVKDLEEQKKLAIFPQHTKFTIKVRCPTDPDNQFVAAGPLDQEINLEHKAIAFKTLLKPENVVEFTADTSTTNESNPADDKEPEAKSKPSSSGEDEQQPAPKRILRDGAALIEVQIQTQMPTLEDKVSEKAQQATASFWKGVSALGSTLTSLKDSVAKQVSAQLHALESTREEEVGGGGGDEGPTVPWEIVPTRWRTRESEWRQLISEHLPIDELTFTRGPEREFSSDETVMLAQVGIMAKTIKNANSSFNFEKDVHEGLLKLPILRKQRYQLVPKFIDDETFWRNYFWKCAALGSCSSDEQAKVLLTILNTPPEQPQETNPQLEMKPDAFKSLTTGDSGDEEADGTGGQDNSTAGVDGEKKTETEGDSNPKLPSPATSPSSSSAAAAATGQYPIFPPFSHSDIATMVAEASDATSLLQDLISDEKEGEGNSSVVDQSMWDAAERSCQSQLKDLQGARAKIHKFASASGNSTKPADIELLSAPLDAALESVEATIAAAKEHKEEKKKLSVTAEDTKNDQQSPKTPRDDEEQKSEAAVEETVANDGENPDEDVNKEGPQVETVVEQQEPSRKTPSPASWSDEDKEETPIDKEEGKTEKNTESPKASRPVATTTASKNFEDEFDDFPTIDDDSPTSKPAVVSKADQTPKTSSPTTTAAMNAAGGGSSTAKKSTVSSSSDFSKMPWEEDEEE